MDERPSVRENLLGYLIGALEADEVAAIEAALARETSAPNDTRAPDSAAPPGAAGRAPAVAPGGCREADASNGHRTVGETLAILGRALDPLRADETDWECPAGLATRTMARVRREASERIPRKRAFSPPPRPAPRRQGAWVDRLLVAATAVAACVLVVPLLREAIEDSRTRRTERNLGVVAEALHGYADTHRVFPTPPDEGPLSRAGLYAPTLVAERRLVSHDGSLLVPGSRLSRSGFRVPTLEELEAAIGTDDFDRLVRNMGGDFGYTLGHRDAEGHLEPIRDRRRAHHPIMADAPDASGHSSFNHPGGLHHVLFEDGHIERLFHDDIRGEDDPGNDHLYRNHRGTVAAGIDEEDAVVGASQSVP
jgi:hypothetical protein